MKDWSIWNPPLKCGDHVKLKDLEHDHLSRLLSRTGSVQETASIVGLHKGALSRKIQREKIPWLKNPPPPPG